MKPLRKHLKLIALFLAVTFLVQSCKTYHSGQFYNSGTVSVDEAILSNKKVIVSTPNANTYYFDRLYRVDDKIFGTVKKRTYTAKKLISYIVNKDTNNRYVDILIPKNSISKIQLHNKTKTIIIKAVASIVLTPLLLYLALVAYY